MGKYIGKYVKKRKMKKTKIVLIVLAVILALILALLIGGVVYYNSFLNRINRFDDSETISSEELDVLLSTVEGADLDEDAVIGTTPETLDVMNKEEEETIGGEIINILLIGQDTRVEGQRGLSDSMILVSVNTETKKLVMTSFMRDLYIEIPATSGGYYRQRINTAYAVGGMEKLNATLEHNFGVEVDNNIEVDFSGFKTIVDAMGGIDIELTKAEAYHLNTYKEYSAYGWTLKEGLNHLDGAQALAYARIRKIDSDFYRTERQRTVLNKLFEKVKDMSLKELLALAEEFIPLITTDMSNSEITNYIVQLAPILSELEVITQRIPVDGSWWGADVGTEEQPMYVIYCSLAQNRELLRNTIGIEETE